MLTPFSNELNVMQKAIFGLLGVLGWIFSLELIILAALRLQFSDLSQMYFEMALPDAGAPALTTMEWEQAWTDSDNHGHIKLTQDGMLHCIHVSWHV